MGLMREVTVKGKEYASMILWIAFVQELFKLEVELYYRPNISSYVYIFCSTKGNFT